MWTLHEVGRRCCHVVAKVVETELVVCTECDVGVVCAAAFRGVGLCLVDAVNRKTVEHVERTHPLGVTFGEVVVDGDHVHAVSCQGVEKHRQRCHKCLSLTGCHLGDFALMKHDAADKLYVVVDHVPSHLVSTCHPVVVVDGFAVVDFNEVFALGGEFAVEIGRGHFD